MMKRPDMIRIWLMFIGCLAFANANAFCVSDDKQRQVCLDQHAGRIATLSPGATELAYAAGAGDKVVAVVSFSDYPPEAKQVASVGSYSRLDLERLISLKPDLVLAWVTGNSSTQMETLEKLGMTIYYLEPHTFDGIAITLENIATLAGSEEVGHKEAHRFRKGMETLQLRYQAAPKVRTFYQIWDSPLMTINEAHYISKAIALCGGVNVFAESPRLVPRLNQEAVLQANPEAIIAGGMGETNRQWLDPWQGFPELLATRQQNLFFIPPSLIQRPTPRLLQGTQRLCEKLDIARAHRH